MADDGEPWKRDLAERVRALRNERGLSQKDLAARSSISQRFLADVEGGRANPSLGSLHDLAGGLGVDVTDLLARSSGDDVSALPIALLGLRGAGKSSVGRRLAHKLKRRFVELDREIEREAGMSLAELFALHGEAHYRTLEHRVLTQLLDGDEPVVVATGGGVVTHQESYRLLRRRALTVWLKASPQEHWDRVLAQGDQRPMAMRARARAELEELYAQRAPLYAQAAVIVDTSALDLDAAAERIRTHAASPNS